MRSPSLRRIPVLLAIALIGMGALAAACEKNNDVVAQQQIRESQNACPNGCEAAPPGCEIKGNISATGVKYYHLPSDQDYAGIRIQPEKGERWFCTVDEAQRNGWKLKPGE